MSLVTVSAHPLMRHYLTILREKNTSPDRFRQALHQASFLLLYEALNPLPTRKVWVETPLEATEGLEIAARIGFVPILRAGLGMVDAALTLVPTAQVWHLGFKRDEETLKPVVYYNPLADRELLPVDIAIILDPMLATGGSASAAARLLKEHGVQDVRFVGLIAAPEGIAQMRQAHPDVPLFLGAVDRQLNDRGYILPGLGDAGDRLFATA